MREKEKEKPRIGVEESDLIREIRAKRDLASDIYTQAREVGDAFRKLDVRTLASAKEKLSKLEAGMRSAGEFPTTIASLAVGFADELQKYTDSVKETGSYQGIEKLVKFFDQQKAHNMRVGRLEKQSPEENLKMVTDYVENIIREVLDTREKEVGITYDQLKTNVDLIVAKITEFQPLEAQLKEKLNAMEADYKDLNEQLKTATDEEQARLVQEKNILHEDLSKVREDYDAVLTVYNEAQNSILTNEKSRDAFEMSMRNLAMQSVMLKEKLDNLTVVYRAAPKMIKAMHKTKGMEVSDKVMNKAAEECFELIVEGSEGIAETTTARAKLPTIDEEKVRELGLRINNVFIQYGIDIEEISAQARRSQQDRYGTDM